MRDPHAALVRALEALAAPCQVEQAGFTRWSSATFTGARHDVRLLVEGRNAAERLHLLARQLPDHAFAIRGHLVADITAVADPGKCLLVIEALTLEET